MKEGFLLKIFFGPVAQLVRASPCHGEGREFESRPVRSYKKTVLSNRFFVYRINRLPYFFLYCIVGGEGFFEK